jgi:hypothetical protein
LNIKSIRQAADTRHRRAAEPVGTNKTNRIIITEQRLPLITRPQPLNQVAQLATESPLGNCLAVELGTAQFGSSQSGLALQASAKWRARPDHPAAVFPRSGSNISYFSVVDFAPTCRADCPPHRAGFFFITNSPSLLFSLSPSSPPTSPRIPSCGKLDFPIFF